MASPGKNRIVIAVEGCCHGELDKIYATILQRNPKVELLLVCGDFQCVSSEEDLQCVAMPPKYR
jgi:lariat debranching enzyme